MPPSWSGRGLSGPPTYAWAPRLLMTMQPARLECAVPAPPTDFLGILTWPARRVLLILWCDGWRNGPSFNPHPTSQTRKLRSRKVRSPPEATQLRVSELEFKSTEPLTQKQLLSEEEASQNAPTCFCHPNPTTPSLPPSLSPQTCSSASTGSC